MITLRQFVRDTAINLDGSFLIHGSDQPVNTAPIVESIDRYESDCVLPLALRREVLHNIVTIKHHAEWSFIAMRVRHDLKGATLTAKERAAEYPITERIAEFHLLDNQVTTEDGLVHQNVSLDEESVAVVDASAGGLNRDERLLRLIRQNQSDWLDVSKGEAIICASYETIFEAGRGTQDWWPNATALKQQAHRSHLLKRLVRQALGDINLSVIKRRGAAK